MLLDIRATRDRKLDKRVKQRYTPPPVDEDGKPLKSQYSTPGRAYGAFGVLPQIKGGVGKPKL